MKVLEKNIGEKAELVCKTEEGTPTPTVQWMKDGARYLKQKVTKYVPLTSGSNPHSYEATKAAAKKAQKKGSKGIRTHDLCDNSVMLYQLSYEASLEAGQERVQFIPNLLYEESEMCI